MIDEYQLHLISEFRRGGGVTLLIQFRLNEKLKISVVIYVGRWQKMASRYMQNESKKVQNNKRFYNLLHTA